MFETDHMLVFCQVSGSNTEKLKALGWKLQSLNTWVFEDYE